MEDLRNELEKMQQAFAQLNASSSGQGSQDVASTEIDTVQQPRSCQADAPTPRSPEDSILLKQIAAKKTALASLEKMECMRDSPTVEALKQEIKAMMDTRDGLLPREEKIANINNRLKDIQDQRSQLADKVKHIMNADKILEQEANTLHINLQALNEQVAQDNKAKALQALGQLPAGAAIVSPEVANAHATFHSCLQQMHDPTGQLATLLAQFQQVVGTLPPAVHIGQQQPTHATQNGLTSSQSLSSLPTASQVTPVRDGIELATKLQKTLVQPESISIHSDDEMDDQQLQQVFQDAQALQTKP